MVRGETGRKPRTRAFGRGRTRTGGIRTAPTAVYSVASFCAAFGISEAFFYKLKSQGLAPVVMRLGSRLLISFEAAKRWQQAREKATEQATEKSTVTA